MLDDLIKLQEALEAEKRVSTALAEQVAQLSNPAREVRLAAYRECLEVCRKNDDGDSIEDINQMIHALEHPESTRT